MSWNIFDQRNDIVWIANDDQEPMIVVKAWNDKKVFFKNVDACRKKFFHSFVALFAIKFILCIAWKVWISCVDWVKVCVEYVNFVALLVSHQRLLDILQVEVEDSIGDQLVLLEALEAKNFFNLIKFE